MLRQGAHLWQPESCGDNPGSLALAASVSAVCEQSLRPSPTKQASLSENSRLRRLSSHTLRPLNFHHKGCWTSCLLYTWALDQASLRRTSASERIEAVPTSTTKSSFRLLPRHFHDAEGCSRESCRCASLGLWDFEPKGPKVSVRPCDADVLCLTSHDVDIVCLCIRSCILDYPLTVFDPACLSFLYCYMPRPSLTSMTSKQG